MFGAASCKSVPAKSFEQASILFLFTCARNYYLWHFKNAFVFLYSITKDSVKILDCKFILDSTLQVIWHTRYKEDLQIITVHESRQPALIKF